MRILHTSDWHLGKSLKTRPRIQEQDEFLSELFDVIKAQNVDVLLVAGDIFDTSVPKAEAEELFFSHLAKLSTLCKIVCISGNHDDGDRLCSPRQIALSHGIFLINGMDNSHFCEDGAEGGDGFLRLLVGQEKLNLGLLPYPFFSGIISQTTGENHTERVAQLIERCAAGFGDGVNIFVSHLFVGGAELAEERELGTAPLVPKSIFPDCDYVALGHIHKPQSLSKSRKIFYSGSPISYSFDDTTQKFWLIFDSCLGQVQRIPVVAGAKLLTAVAQNFDEAESALDGADGFVKIVYQGTPMTLSEIKKLKSYPALADIKFEPILGQAPKIFKADSSPLQLFEAYYTAKFLESPSKDLTQLFLSILGGDDEAN